MTKIKSKKYSPKSYKLNINDKRQSLQGVVIPNKEMYQQIRFVIENNHLEGWEPGKEDVEYLLKNAMHPDPKLIKEYKKIFADN